MKKLLVVRADATARMGAGHIIRCIALAQEWRRGSGEVIFVSRCESPALRRRIVREGFGFIGLEKRIRAGGDLARTLEALGTSGGARSAAWLVIDGYHFTPEYQSAIRARGYRVLVIDDTAHLARYSADILLNQNINACRLRYRCGRDTVKLLGCAYTLLRTEFREYKRLKRRIPGKAKHILVTMGGADEHNVGAKVIAVLRALNDPSLAIKVVAGPLNKNSVCAGQGIEFVRDARSMPALMAWADIAVSGGGGTCWEMAFMGLPHLILVLAENQRAVAEALGKRGMAINAGWHTRVGTSVLAKLLGALIGDAALRGRMSKAGSSAVTGDGARRVVARMEGIGRTVLRAERLKLRRAAHSDCRLIWKWANDPAVRAQSLTREPIPYAEHARWFTKKMSDPAAARIWILCRGRTRLGQIRYDRVGDDAAQISYSVAAPYRGRGVGETMLKSTLGMARETLRVKRLTGVILRSNTASARVFEKAGFRCLGAKRVKGIACTSWEYGGSAVSREGAAR